MNRVVASSLSVLAVLSATAPALAQSIPGQSIPGQSNLAPSGSRPAAATLPNTFDEGAAARAPGQAVPPRPTPPPAPSAPASDPATVAAAEAMLRKTIAALQAGAPNYGDMSADLASKVREQSSAITPLVQSFGAVQDLAHVGDENGAELFLVLFANQHTQWIIAQNPEGKIVALLFRPAPSAGD